MKKLVLTVLTLTLFHFSYAQNIDFGAKAGLNYNFGGDLSELIEQTGTNLRDIPTGADNKAGYHFGLWARFKFAGMYVRPEVIYTELKNSYNNSSTASPNDLSTNFTTKKIDIPVLFGYKVIGPLTVYAGPAFQFFLDSEFNTNQIENIRTKDFTVGMQIGTGLELGRLGVDIRWEKGFSNKLLADSTFPGTNIKLDNRPNQIIFSLSYRFTERNDR